MEPLSESCPISPYKPQSISPVGVPVLRPYKEVYATVTWHCLDCHCVSRRKAWTDSLTDLRTMVLGHRAESGELTGHLFPLQYPGEHMTEEEMSDCFASLLGLNPEGWKSEPAASSVKGTGAGSVRARSRAHRSAVDLRAFMSPDCASLSP